MAKWSLLVTRESDLLERYIRMLGYDQMFGRLSRVHYKKYLIVSHQGLTSIYTDQLENKRNLKLSEQEFFSGVSKKLVIFWEREIKHMQRLAQMTRTDFKIDDFKKFITSYQIIRSAVLYNDYLWRVIERDKKGGWRENLELIGHWHERAERASAGAWDSLAPFFARVAKKYGLPKSDLMFYSPDEFFDLVNSGKKISKHQIAQRHDYYVLVCLDGRPKLFLGNKARALAKRELPVVKYVSGQELRGVAAAPGVAIGKVRIVNTKKEMKKMRKGEVVVSYMTTPRLMAAMKKAAAIVTDEGGLTCHAAIVSRELGIP